MGFYLGHNLDRNEKLELKWVDTFKQTTGYGGRGKKNV